MPAKAASTTPDEATCLATADLFNLCRGSKPAAHIRARML
jgi:hypothetical protein